MLTEEKNQYFRGDNQVSVSISSFIYFLSNARRMTLKAGTLAEATEFSTKLASEQGAS